MSITPSPSLPLPYKNRRGWLIAFGVIEILMGLGCLLLATFMMLVFLRFWTSPATHAQSPGTLVAGESVYILAAAFFFLAGTGSIQCKNWARILMLIASGFWLVLGVFIGGIVAFMVPKMMQAQHNVPPGTERAVMAVMISMVVLLGILLPVVFLIFYSRKSVKATCLARNSAQAAAPAAAPAPSAGFPLPLIILMVWEALGTLGVFSLLTFHVTVVFGWAVHGGPMLVLVLAHSVLSAAAAWFVYKRRLIGWHIALWKAGFWGASTVVTLTSHNLDKVFSQVLVKPEQRQVLQMFPHFMQWVLAGSILTMAAYLVLVVYCRKFFDPPNAAS
jgi:MFS family permease